MNALILFGGWEGHRPDEFASWAESILSNEECEIEISDSLGVLADSRAMADIDLIVPIWSSARSSHRPEFGNISKTEEEGLLSAIEGGCGIAGWHGHMGDAFRDHPTYHFMIGGQFVGHPPGWPDNTKPENDFIRYRVNIAKKDDPIISGISDFELVSEQYYMLVDPSNDVLATTTFSGEYLPWIEGSVIPVVWKRRWGQGRIFYCSIGHTVTDLNIPEVREMMRRGMIWAGRR